jgi:hypothetical protein
MSETLFQNGQWAVTDWGLESVRPGAPYAYNIAAERQLETGAAGGGKFYDWPIQMAEKTLVDTRAFSEAFRKALEIHREKYKGEVNHALLEESFKEAQRRGVA